MVTEQALEKFKEIYYKKYKVKLTNEEATEQAISFLNLMKLLIRPNHK